MHTVKYDEQMHRLQIEYDDKLKKIEEKGE
jgi:hypothetical protein